MHLLIVDDDNDFRRTASRRLRRLGHQALDFEAPQAALEQVRQTDFEVALIDLVMPEMSGIDLLEKLKELLPDCQVVLLTGQASVESAVAAMKRGAFDYVTKPCPFGELEAVLTKAHEHYRLSRENVRLRAALERSSPSSEIVGDSPGIRKVLRLIEKAGPSDSSVLILGESGTGKELVARALHRLSPRAAKPMVTINCAALQESLLESELFGHEKGAFTGAVGAKMGLFEVANGGTLFIDEVGELAGGLQAKLLRVLEDGSLRRVGSTRQQKVDVRVIAATNKDLAEEVRDGRFRDDLYFRINVLTIQVPPLRRRREDIPQLIEHFLRRSPRASWRISEEAGQAMRAYDWPGNVRELANVIERATILAEDDWIGLDDLPELVAHPPREGLAAESDEDVETDDLAELERRRVAAVLQRERGSKSRAAKALGISRRSLYRLIKKYGIETPEES